MAVLERVADLLADGRAARLAQQPHAMAQRRQPLGQQLDLRGFAAAFGAFERDETAFCHLARSVNGQVPDMKLYFIRCEWPF